MILNNIDNLYIGASEADKLCLGGTVIWNKAEIITFADSKVKAICVQYWDTNNDGELDTQEAAAVTSLDDNFDAVDDITSFNELRYFTGLTSIGWAEFDTCESLVSITIPENVTVIGGSGSVGNSFADCYALTTVTMLPTTPPTVRADEFGDSTLQHIYVPAGSVSAYQSASNWSQWASIISAIPS